MPFLKATCNLRRGRDLLINNLTCYRSQQTEENVQGARPRAQEIHGQKDQPQDQWRQTGTVFFSFRSRIHRIHMFLGLHYPDPLVRGMDPDLSIIMQK